jgi:hypothetical protein
MSMKEGFPLYPTLAPEAQLEAQALMDDFKEKMFKLCEETLGKLYCDVSAYIESDHWTNYRNDLLDGLQNYGNRKVQASYDFAKIRRAILNEYREEIIQDLNQDLLEEIDKLKKEVEYERGYRRYQ